MWLPYTVFYANNIFSTISYTFRSFLQKEQRTLWWPEICKSCEDALTVFCAPHHATQWRNLLLSFLFSEPPLRTMACSVSRTAMYTTSWITPKSPEGCKYVGDFASDSQPWCLHFTRDNLKDSSVLKSQFKDKQQELYQKH